MNHVVSGNGYVRIRIAWDRKDTTKNRMRKGRAPNYLSMMELMILPQATPSRRAEKRDSVV